MVGLLMILQHAGHEMHEQVQQAAGEPIAALGHSLFDHHLAGAMIILLGVLAYLEHSEAARYRFVRILWPLPLLAVALSIFIWSDREEPWLRWFLQGEWTKTELEHKFMEAAAILIGLVELFRRTGWLKHRAWRQVINVLMLFAGLILMFHHGNHVHIIHVQHLWMATVILTLAITKAISDLQKEPGILAQYVVPLLLVISGLQLALYVE